MICPLCKKEMLWNNDFTNNDFGIEEEGITSLYTCINDKCDVDDVSITQKFKKLQPWQEEILEKVNSENVSAFLNHFDHHPSAAKDKKK